MSENQFLQLTQNDLVNYSKEQLIQLHEKFIKENINIKNENMSLKKEIVDLKNYTKILEEKIVIIEGQLVLFKSKLFRKKSEKSPQEKKYNQEPNSKSKKKRGHYSLLPSERYPEAAIIERHIEFKDNPNCSCCGYTMEDSGMTEDSEYLTVVPKDYYIVRQRRHKYRCSQCHGDIKTAPSAARIIPGSAYGDELIIDVAMAKYCDLVPIERYSTIAGREGFVDLPPNSLIGTTHKLADYVQPAVDKIKEEILSSPVLHADETPHRMLEGDEKKSWYLWGFSNNESSYFEIRNTRSGDVASELLTQSQCQYLVSDVFSGYEKAVKESNKIREQNCQPQIHSVYCNAHSRRKFKEAEESFPEETQYFIKSYQKIYQLEKEGQNEIGTLTEKREAMNAIFEDMRKTATLQKDNFSSKSTLVTASNYFLKNYSGLTLFLTNSALPIDNNHQERQLRNPVIGRKTWHGTHSKQGAKTTAIFFTLVESCKLNKINPRHYFKKLVASLHAGKPAFTPKEFKAMHLDTG
jgi:transposase